MAWPFAGRSRSNFEEAINWELRKDALEEWDDGKARKQAPRGLAGPDRRKTSATHAIKTVPPPRRRIQEPEGAPCGVMLAVAGYVVLRDRFGGSWMLLHQPAATA